MKKSYVDTLKECVQIAEERQKSYGMAQDSLSDVAEICWVGFGLKLSPADVAKVLISLKLSREKFLHHKDNLIDCANYELILNLLLEES